MYFKDSDWWMFLLTIGVIGFLLFGSIFLGLRYVYNHVDWIKPTPTPTPRPAVAFIEEIYFWEWKGGDNFTGDYKQVSKELVKEYCAPGPGYTYRVSEDETYYTKCTKLAK